MRHPLFGDFDFLFGEEEPDPNGQVYVQFEDERGSEEQTETDVKNLEGRTRMSLQQLKEQILGTVSSYFEILRKAYCMFLSNHHLKVTSVEKLKKNEKYCYSPKSCLLQQLICIEI